MDLPSSDLLDVYFYVCTFVIGSMVGSFLNVCVSRLPEGLSVVRPRSRCPKCENPIVWYDNIPMLSWLILGAKCRHCKKPISWQYPLVEALTGGLFLLVYWRFGIVLASGVYMALAASLVLVTFIDLADWTIPNEVTFPGMPIGIAFSVVAMFYPESGLLLDNPFMAIGGLFLGGGVLYGLDKLSLLMLGKRGMGFGDVKLMAMLGAFFGPQGVLLILVMASLIGSVIGVGMIVFKRSFEGAPEEGHYLPFGPYIALGGIVYLFIGPQMIAAYVNYLDIPGALGTAIP